MKLTCTHSPFDHVSGMVSQGRAVYPDAEIYVDRQDIAHLTASARPGATPDFLHFSLDIAAAPIAATQMPFPGIGWIASDQGQHERAAAKWLS